MLIIHNSKNLQLASAGSNTPLTPKMQFYVILDNGWKLLTYVTKSSILDIAGSSNRNVS